MPCRSRATSYRGKTLSKTGIRLGLMHQAAAHMTACALLAFCSPIGRHCNAAEEHEAM